MTSGIPAILFSGGYAHPFDESSAALASIATDAGCSVSIETQLDAALEKLASAKLLIINALYWTMTQNDKYAPHRDQWAFELNSSQLATIRNFISDGGSLFASHTATICFDTQPGWIELLGGGWTWDHSWHPPLGSIHVEPTEAAQNMCLGLKPFDVMDECYHNLDPADDATILATCDMGNGAQPLIWTRKYGAGKVAVNALGHDERSLMEPQHAMLNRNIFAWTIENEEAQNA